jgi:hypothetical protein
MPEAGMQQGSLIKSIRKRGPDVWQFRWAERGPQGKRIYRKRVIGTVCQYSDADSARTAVTGLLTEINSNGLRRDPFPLTVKEVCNQFEQRELTKDNIWRSYSTKKSYKAGLKWCDIDFAQHTMNEVRSIVYGVVGSRKTESSQKPVPVHPAVLEELRKWRELCRYNKSGDWVFASRRHRGRKPIGARRSCASIFVPPLRRSEFGSNSMAHFPAHVFDFATQRWDRIQSDAGVVAASSFRSPFPRWFR